MTQLIGQPNVEPQRFIGQKLGFKNGSSKWGLKFRNVMECNNRLKWNENELP